MTLLRCIARISSAKVFVRDIRVQLQLLACLYITLAVIVGIRCKDRSTKVVLTLANGLHVLFGASHQRLYMVVIRNRAEPGPPPDACHQPGLARYSPECNPER